MSTQQEYPLSPLAKIFPPWPREQLELLREDIATHGLRDPIAIWRGLIIDGRHRHQACIGAGVTPEYQFLPDHEDPVAFILGQNLIRRHLNESQRAVAAFNLTATLGSLPQVKDPRTGEIFPRRLTQREAAQLLGVSDRSVKHAARVLSPRSRAVPPLREAVALGRISVSDGSSITNHSEQVQRQAVAMVLAGEARTAAGAARRFRSQLPRLEGAPDPDISGPDVSPGRFVLHPSPVSHLHHLVPENTVDAIVTFPPPAGGHASLLADLAAFASHSLRPTGVMLVLADTRDLPQTLNLISHDELRWVCALHYTHPGNPFPGRSGDRIPLTQKLLLVYGKPHFRLDAGPDAFFVPPLPEGSSGSGRSPRLDTGMELIIERFTLPHHVVADPILAGRHETAVAAMNLGRNFIGAWDDGAFMDRLRARLARRLPADDHDGGQSDGFTTMGSG